MSLSLWHMAYLVESVKKRLLFLCGCTRIHVDKVESLGNFVELEVVLDENLSQKDAIKEAYELMAKLGIKPSMLIQDAYVDMIKVNQRE